MNDRVVKNPNFKNNGDFHRSLAARGVGAKGFPNTHTEVEHLGNRKFAASIGVGHRVFFDKADGNKPKRHKLTDERPGKDYVLVQGAKCCVEVYPYYAKYFDVQHEEVRLYEERWVVQRLFSEPDDWRDVDAYNPVITVEEYPEPAGDVVKVTVTYDTDYGVLVVEYFQRDGNALKHNVAFKNTSGPTETFRVLQRWAGITGTKVNNSKIVGKTVVKDTIFTFGDDTEPFRLRESSVGLGEQGLKDVLEMLAGSREFVTGEKVLVDENGIKLAVEGYTVYLQIDGKVVMTSTEKELSSIVRVVEDCPNNARVFIGGLGLGIILFPLSLSRKAREVIVCEKDSRVIDTIAPLVENRFGRHFNLTIIQGDAVEEVANHGTFDWIFMDIGVSIPEEYCTAYLTQGGRYTDWTDPEMMEANRVFYLKSVEIDISPQGMKADFIYGDWVLAQNESLKIDPDSVTLDDPTQDGDLGKSGSSQAACNADAPERQTIGTYLRLGGEGKDDWRMGYRAYVEWPIDSLAGLTLSANPIFKFHGYLGGGTEPEINPLTEEQPSSGGCTDAELWGYIGSGAAYVDPWEFTSGTQNLSQDLGAAAKTDLQAAIDAEQSWFAIGLQRLPTECPVGAGGQFAGIYSEEKTDAANPKPTLYVEYTPAAVGLENKSANMAAKMVAAGLI